MSEDQTRAGANPAEPSPPTPIELPAEISNPNITEMLLNAQLAESLSILRDAAYLYRTSLEVPVARSLFIDNATSVMKASAEIAAMIHKLRNGQEQPPAIHQKFTVERIVRPKEEGEGEVPILKND